jgi:3-deoxy-D-manno-octulosonate 8-phosphate phosphatase (KDO 8-P phosphatase)
MRTEPENKLKNLKLLLLDVDGVLTSGEIIYNDSGQEIKFFNVKDGLGLRLLMEAGVKVAIVTGRRSHALTHRCRNLGIDQIFEGVRDKLTTLNRILSQMNVTTAETGFLGDDLPDLAIMKHVGISIAVADAHEIIIALADVVTSAKGGQGAVREVCELILKSKGVWETILKRFG